jgi:error-prone DNA polymerase
VSALYAELHCISSFSFLRGASPPEELIARACELGYAALALTDECSVAGVVRAHAALAERVRVAQEAGKPPPLTRLIVGAEFCLDCGLRVAALASDRTGYGALCRCCCGCRVPGRASAQARLTHRRSLC